MNVNIETNTLQDVSSNELDVIAKELCGVKLSLADSGVPIYHVQSVSTDGIQALASDGVHNDTQSALHEIGITVQSAITYQRILDPEVRRILSIFFNGQEGMPIKYTDVVNSQDTNFKNLFQSNASIINFDEFKYFSWYNAHGNFSFSHCNNLESIDLSNVLNFPNGCFGDCGNLNYFHGNNSTKGHLIINGNATLGTSVFDQNTTTNGINIGLTNVVFQEGITTIPARFFRDVRRLKEVTIPSSCTSIGNQAFYACSAIERVNIVDLDNWVNIDYGDTTSNPLNAGNGYLYLNGQKVISYIYPDDATQVKKYTWRGVNGLEQVYLPQTITYIGESAFLNCVDLVISNLSLPNLESLGSYAFKGTKVQTISDLGSITSIPQYCFQNCSELTSVIIPNSVTSIANNAFDGCTSLVTLDLSNVTSLGNYSMQRTAITNGVLNAPITNVSNGTFAWCTLLQTVDITGATVIGKEAFYHCESLKKWYGLNSTDGELNLPNLTNISGISAFESCNELVNVISLGSITSIPQSCFKNCKKLQSVTIPNGVTLIDSATFQGCSSLASVIIPASVTKIMNSAFDSCSGLTSMTINATTPPVLASPNALRVTNNCPIYVPAGSVSAYQSAQNWSTYASRIQAIPT